MSAVSLNALLALVSANGHEDTQQKCFVEKRGKFIIKKRIPNLPTEIISKIFDVVLDVEVIAKAKEEHKLKQRRMNYHILKLRAFILQKTHDETQDIEKKSYDPKGIARGERSKHVYAYLDNPEMENNGEHYNFSSHCLGSPYDETVQMVRRLGQDVWRIPNVRIMNCREGWALLGITRCPI